MHQGKSVGAIIKDSSGNYLVQYRFKKPVGLAMPAGHIDESESPEETLKREVFEETGLSVGDAKLVFRRYINSEDGPCAKGHDGHEWWVYEVTTTGEPQLKEPEKHGFLKFMSVEEMRPYIEKHDYDPAWFEHILPALQII